MFTKVASFQSITDIVILDFSVILLPGMLISYYAIIYFSVNNFFPMFIFQWIRYSNALIYLSFGWEIGHPSSMYVTRGMERGHPKRREGYHAPCVRTHLHYLFPCFSHMVSFFICRNLVIFFNIYVRFRLKQPYGRNSYSKCVHMLTMETGGWKIGPKIRTY